MDQSGESVLLVTSCTTGWMDWVHGELWLCPDGLLRLTLGMMTTVVKSSSPNRALAYDLAAREAGRQHFDMAQINELVSRKRGNVWVPWAQIRDASLRGGIMNGRLRLKLADGRSVKFLWSRNGKVFRALREALQERLGPGVFRLG